MKRSTIWMLMGLISGVLVLAGCGEPEEPPMQQDEMQMEQQPGDQTDDQMDDGMDEPGFDDSPMDEQD